MLLKWEDKKMFQRDIKVPLEASYGYVPVTPFHMALQRLEVRLIGLLGYGEEQLPQKYSYP
jgi:EamA domain-containing membrane protein RarD